MSLCASCGLQLFGAELCLHHARAYADDWGQVNRIMCAFFHRGVEPPRLSEPERFDTNILSTPAEQNVVTYAEGYE